MPERHVLLQVLYIEVVLRASLPLEWTPELAEFLHALRSTVPPASLSGLQFAALYAGWTLFTCSEPRPGRCSMTRQAFDQLVGGVSDYELQCMIEVIYDQWRAVQQLMMPPHLLIALEAAFAKLSDDGALTPSGSQRLMGALQSVAAQTIGLATVEAALGSELGVVTLPRFVTGVFRLCKEDVGPLLQAINNINLIQTGHPRRKIASGTPPGYEHQAVMVEEAVTASARSNQQNGALTGEGTVVDRGMQHELERLLHQSGGSVTEQALLRPTHITPAYLEALLRAFKYEQ